MKIKIDVTQEDIGKGERGCQSRCPVALACRRAGIKEALVGTGALNYLTTANDAVKIHVVPLPQEVKDFVSRFDYMSYRGGVPQLVEPFSFELELED